MNSKSERESGWSASGLALTIVGEDKGESNMYRRAMAIMCDVMMIGALAADSLGRARR